MVDNISGACCTKTYMHSVYIFKKIPRLLPRLQAQMKEKRLKMLKRAPKIPENSQLLYRGVGCLSIGIFFGGPAGPRIINEKYEEKFWPQALFYGQFGKCQRARVFFCGNLSGWRPSQQKAYSARRMVLSCQAWYDVGEGGDSSHHLIAYFLTMRRKNG